MADATKDAPLASEATLEHVTRGRARLRLVEDHDAEACEALAERLAAIAGMERVVIRPNTRSVILEAPLDEAAMEAFVRAQNVVSLVEPDDPVPVGQMAQWGFWAADMEIRGRTQGSLDLRTSLALGLVATALFQAARGQIAAPATTLFLQALLLLLDRKDA